MRRRLIHVGGLVLAVGLFVVGPAAQALITRPIPLKGVLAENPFICIAQVEKVDPARPATVFTVEEDLKGKFPHRRLPVNLTGDKEAAKYKHTPQLLKRLAPKLPLILFGLEDTDNNRFIVFGYTNGTWFQMLGDKGDGKSPIVWAFTHCEPYLRGTFKGTTAELRRVIADGLSGKKAPPEPNLKELPGLGPEVPAAKSGCLPASPRVATRGLLAGPLFAIIPTVGVGGPLAILAVLFPTLFGGVLLLFKRWLAFFTVVSVTSLIYCVHAWWLAGAWLGSWWSTPAGLWFVLTVVTFAGTVWAWRRHIRTVTGEDVAPEAPQRTEHMVLGVLSVACLGVIIFCVFDPPSLFEPWWGLLLAFSFGIWVATLYKLFHALLAANQPGLAPALATAPREVMAFAGGPSENVTALPSSAAGSPLSGAGLATMPGARNPRRPTLPTEGVMLWVALFTCVVFAATRPGGRAAVAGDDRAGEGRPSAKFLADKMWVKVFDGTGSILSSPLVADGKAYLTAACGALNRYGSLYCVDVETQQLLWTFTNKKKMREGFSSPVLADGRLYFGEGFHQDNDCKLYCLDAKTGNKLWEFQTTSHTESTPVVVGGRVYFGAGDDGVYCVDAINGKKIWQFPEQEAAKKFHLHVDSTPAVAGKRVYVGGGIDEDTGAGDPAIVCLDADTGKVVWVRETPRWMVKRDDAKGRQLPLPAWGSPVVDGKQVFFGLGNG
ncbi:MAG TPA: PQQ-binding-like beta-propeller repeat protein, partial [Gemmataceae bacterium]|nr:PQQ-binding-like beta-propeller repeat protein [Gemmataceae bacterium]